jgi:hypothetical protein
LTWLKLYFLLSDSPTSLNEDDEVFRTFFDRRYNSLANGFEGTPAIMRDTKKWLNDEVFVQHDGGERTQEIDEEQRQFEEELARDILEARNGDRHRRRLAARLMNGEACEDSNEDY